MNTSVKTALLVTFAATLQFVAPASHAQGRLTLRCAPLHMPTQQDVGRALGLSNFAQVYSARERLMRSINHACLSGAQQVTLISDPIERAHLNGSPRVAAKIDHPSPDLAR